MNALKSIKDNLLSLITSQYRLDIKGVHGISHWKRVEKFGLFLADTTKADVMVVSHFAYLHDSQRQDELEDIDHGKRAADFVRELYGAQKLDLTTDQLGQLQFACYYHNERRVFKINDATIQTCWDADRLDLWRIGVKPNPDCLHTEIAKKSVEVRGVHNVC